MKQGAFPRDTSVGTATSFAKSKGYSSIFFFRIFKLIEPIHDSKFFSFLRRNTSFYRLHLCYILALIFTGTLLLWLSPKPSDPISFMDALFTATSASTVTGLFCLSMSQLSIFDKLVLMCLMTLGSHWFTSLLPILVRRFYFYKFLKQAQSVLTAVGPLVELTTPAKNWNTNNNNDDDVNPNAIISEKFSSQNDNSKDGFVRAWLETKEEEDKNEKLNQVSIQQENYSTMSAESDSKHSNHSNHSKNSNTSEFYPPDVIVPLGSSPTQTKSRLLSFNNDDDGLNPMVTVGNDQPSSDLQPNHISKPNPNPNPNLNPNLDSSSPNPNPNPNSNPSSPNPNLASDEANAANSLAESIKPTAFELQSSMKNEKGEGLSRRFPSLGRNDSIVAGGEMELDEMSLSTEYLASIPAIEYEALRLLSFLVPLYGLFFVSVSFILTRSCLTWSEEQVNALNQNQVNPTFFSAFVSLSSFVNAGIILMDDSLFSFRENFFFLFILSINILVGNTMLAPTMRIIIFLLYKFFPFHHKTVLKYLLENPRKCYTHLFPLNVSLWLVFTVFAFNFLELICFYSLDWNDLGNIATRYKLLIGFFQSINTRNAGFTVVSISTLSPAMLVMYLCLMYISVYPVYLSRQRTRIDAYVFEEAFTHPLKNKNKNDKDSLIFSLDKEIFSQSRMMLAKDSAFLFLSIFIICILHNSRLKEVTDPNFSLFNVIFEVISAYANNGLSLGYTCPQDSEQTCTSPPYSFSGTWKDDAKFALVIVMIAGRHRGLPDNVDTAVSIPKREYVENQSIFASRHDFDLHAIQSVERENTVGRTPVLSDYFPSMGYSPRSHYSKT